MDKSRKKIERAAPEAFNVQSAKMFTLTFIMTALATESDAEAAAGFLKEMFAV